MDERLTEGELLKRLATARQHAEVGSLYKHYKGSLYRVVDLAILESDNQVCVVYEAQYGKKLRYIRPVSVWGEDVEFEGKKLKRFAKTE